MTHHKEFSSSTVALELVFDEDSKSILDGQSRICNWAYNHLLEKANELKKEYKEGLSEKIAQQLYSKRGLRNLLPALKKEHPFLKSVYSSPLKNAALRLSSAVQDYQKSRKGKRKGREVGWPKFRSWKRNWFSLLYDEPNKGFKVEDNELFLSLGVDEEAKRLRVQGKLIGIKALKGKEIRQLRVVQKEGKYLAIFSVKVTVPKQKKIKKFVALDPNHKNLVYGVDNEGNAFEVKSPKFIKTFDKRIDELKSKRDRCLKKSVELEEKKGWRPSNRWAKYNQVLEKTYAKRREQIKTFMFTLSNRLCDQYDLIGIGDYTPGEKQKSKGMNRSMINQSVIGQFKSCLAWVCLKSGKHFVEYDEKNTTRGCSSCHHILSEGLSPIIRDWTCVQCDTHHLRDENAAVNGLRKVRDHFKELLVPCSGLAPVKGRWAWQVLPRGLEISFQG
jgi:putative transposase